MLLVDLGLEGMVVAFGALVVVVAAVQENLGTEPLVVRLGGLTQLLPFEHCCHPHSFRYLQ